MHTTHRGSGATWSRPWSERANWRSVRASFSTSQESLSWTRPSLGTMVGALRRVREAEGELLVVLPETPARRIFEITGLDQVLDVCAVARDAALRATDVRRR